MSDTPKEGAEKLARSRLALLNYLTRKERKKAAQEAHDEAQEHAEDAAYLPGRPAGSGGAAGRRFTGWGGGLRRAAHAWWRHHPAHMALELATPALSSYGRRNPVRYLGIAATVGAVVLVARPWKLISATGLLVAVLKSSQLSSLVISAMSAADLHADDQRPL